LDGPDAAFRLAAAGSVYPVCSHAKLGIAEFLPVHLPARWEALYGLAHHGTFTPTDAKLTLNASPPQHPASPLIPIHLLMGFPNYGTH
jgi:hypothetical protein